MATFFKLATERTKEVGVVDSFASFGTCNGKLVFLDKEWEARKFFKLHLLCSEVIEA